MSYMERVAANILPLSREKEDVGVALKEWGYLGNHQELDPPCSGTCELCEKEGLSYHFEITNRFTEYSLNVGSECIKRFGVAVMDEYGEALEQEEAEAKVDADRRRLVDEARHRRVVNVLVQIAAKNEWPVFEGILENFRKKREFTPRQALAVLKTAYRLQVKYQPSDFKVGLRRDMAKDQITQLSDFEWRLLSPCLRPNQRERASELRRHQQPALRPRGK